MTDVRQSAARRRAIRILATIMATAAIAFGVVTMVIGIVVPEQAPHAFHNVMVATLLLVLSAPPAILVARWPDDPDDSLVILAAVGVAAIATMALSLTLDPFTLPFVVGIGVIWGLRRPGSPWRKPGSPSLVLGLLALAAAGPMIAYALGQAELQRVDHASEHAAFFHWVESSFIAVACLLLAILTAFRPGIYRLAGFMAGAAMVILGGASTLLGAYASAFDGAWAWAAIGWGLAIVLLTAWEAGRSARSS